jgi:hypothetical protein
MEVVSPITFAHANAGGSKRRFIACGDDATSPAASLHHSADENMDDCSIGYGFHATKRRRKNNQDVIGSSALLLQKENNWSISPFLSGTSSSSDSTGKFVGFVVFFHALFN